MSPADQAMAEKAFRNGLIEYDRRHGWRGPLQHLANPNAAAQPRSPALADPPAIRAWQLAAVTAVDAGGAPDRAQGRRRKAASRSTSCAGPAARSTTSGSGCRFVGQATY